MFDINPKLREIKQNYKKFKLVTNFILCFISNECEVYVGGYQSNFMPFYWVDYYFLYCINKIQLLLTVYTCCPTG